MAETTKYFEAITAQRSMLIEDFEHFSDATISLETQCDLARDTVGTAIQENFGAIRPYFDFLSPDDAEILTAYYILNKPQWCLATMYRSTQTICSAKIRMALKRLGLVMAYKGEPPTEATHEVLGLHKVNTMPDSAVTVAQVIEHYKLDRSYTQVASALNLRRSDIRRAITRAAAVLLSDQHDEHVAFGAYIHGLTDKSYLVDPSKRDSRYSHVHRVDPDIVGAFRINVDDPMFESNVWVSRAATAS